jgi:phage FluMu protein Com
MITVRCDACSGRKYNVGLGGMQKKCGKCDGIGYTKANDEIKSVVKRGQKAKDTSCQKPNQEKSLSAGRKSIIQS